MGFLTDDKTALVASENPSAFTDQHGERCTATFDGSNVVLITSDGRRLIARWLQDNGCVAGVPGSFPLSSSFSFTFYDYGGGHQRLNATWTFAGTAEEAIAALEVAGYAISTMDGKHNSAHEQPVNVKLLHMRTRGAFLTGADSGHAIIHRGPHSVALSTRGEIHVGEHNPTTGLGIGFLLHLLERR